MRFIYRRQAEDDATVEAEVMPPADDDSPFRVRVGERVYELSPRLFHRAAFWKSGGEIHLQVDGREYRLWDASQRRRPAPRDAGDLRAPMAGKVIRVCVEAGQAVRAGEPLVILEAMKMEQQIVAPHDGVVTRVRCQEGDQVTAGMELVDLVADSAAEHDPTTTGRRP